MGNDVEAIKKPVNAPSDRKTLMQELLRLGKYFLNQKHTYLESYRLDNEIRRQTNMLPSFGIRMLVTFFIAFALSFVTLVIGLIGYSFQSTSLFFRICGEIAFYQILLVCIAITGFFYVREKLQINKRIDELKGQYEECCAMMPKIYNAAENCFVAYEHCDPNTIYTLYKYIEINRARTYGEALNCMVTDNKLNNIQNGVDAAIYEARMAGIRAECSKK